MTYKVIGRKNLVLFMVALLILLYLTRTVIPFFKFPFLVIYLYAGLYIISVYRTEILKAFKLLISNYLPAILLLLYIVAACFFSNKIYIPVVKDILNAIILISFTIILKIIISDSTEFKKFYNYFLDLILIFAILISLNGIYSYLYSSTYADLYNSMYTNIIKLAADPNFALVPVFFGMILILRLMNNDIPLRRILLYSLVMLIFVLDIFVSGSKRGAILLLLILFILVIIQIRIHFINNLNLRLLARNSRYFLLILIFAVGVVIFIISGTSVYFKNSLLTGIGIKNVAHTKNLIADTIFRYIHFLDKDLNSQYIYSMLWNPVFDPKDPEAWWGNGNYRIARNLTGRNVEIVPSGSKGYLLDSTCLGFSSEVHSYYFLPVKEESVNTGDSIVASVYCYVSDEFDGDAAALRAEGAVKGNPDEYYDLTDKGCWQKLILPLGCRMGDIKIYLYINKAYVKDFSRLKGYVVFAYPEISRITSTDLSKVQSEIKKPALYPGSGASFIRILESGGSGFMNYPAILQKASFLSYVYYISGKQDITYIDTDPVRRWISGIFSEDTCYYGYKADLSVGDVSNDFGEDRLARWKFAARIFFREYNLLQKTVGGGFNFMNWYGFYFLGDKKTNDWPHNPFLSVLLYSGLIGLILYLIFFLKAVNYCLKYRKEYPALLLFFLIVFYFSFFSGSSPFDPPVMGFFFLLPFFIDYIHNTVKKNSQGASNKDEANSYNRIE
jgi:hypothetical protein